MSGTILGIRDIGVNKTDEALCYGSVYIAMTKLTNKLTKLSEVVSALPVIKIGNVACDHFG